MTDEVGEGVGQGTDLQQERNLDKQHHQALHNADDGEDDHQRRMEDVGYSKGETEDDGEEADPLAVDGEVLLFEVGREPTEDVCKDTSDIERHCGEEGCINGYILFSACAQ